MVGSWSKESNPDEGMVVVPGRFRHCSIPKRRVDVVTAVCRCGERMKAVVDVSKKEIMLRTTILVRIETPETNPLLMPAGRKITAAMVELVRAVTIVPSFFIRYGIVRLVSWDGDERLGVFEMTTLATLSLSFVRTIHSFPFPSHT